jgi:hypothetical protein
MLAGGAELELGCQVGGSGLAPPCPPYSPPTQFAARHRPAASATGSASPSALRGPPARPRGGRAPQAPPLVLRQGQEPRAPGRAALLWRSGHRGRDTGVPPWPRGPCLGMPRTRSRSIPDSDEGSHDIKLQDGPWPAAGAGWPKGQGPPVGVPPAAGPAPLQGDRPRPLGPGWAAELWWEGLSPPGGPRPPEPGAHARRPDGQHARLQRLRTRGKESGPRAQAATTERPRRTGRARPLPRSGVPSACSLGPGECHPWRLPPCGPHRAKGIQTASRATSRVGRS